MPKAIVAGKSLQISKLTFDHINNKGQQTISVVTVDGAKFEFENCRHDPKNKFGYIGMPKGGAAEQRILISDNAMTIRVEEI